jgi:hypothetical protein
MQAIESAAIVIDELGGNRSVSKLFGVVPSAVSNWRRHGRFPSDTYKLFETELGRKGLTAAPELWGMRNGTYSGLG